MSTINNKRKIILTVPNIKQDISKRKLSNLVSIVTILFLSCVIITFSVLIFNFVNEIYPSNKYTVTYTGSGSTEESHALRVNF